MRPAPRRTGFTLFQLLVVLAVLLLLLGLLLPAVQNVRAAAARMQSANNLKQLAISMHNYESAYGHLPMGIDENNFSTSSRLLPFIEQENVFRRIDFKKSIDDKANTPMRGLIIKTFLSPLDPIPQVRTEWGATNYLWNDQLFYLNSKTGLAKIADGTSNTVAIGETLKGDNLPQAVSVRRQHVALKKEDLKGLKDDAGVAPFKADRGIASDRCSSWMDGRFLQGTFNGRLKVNDERPDVSCEGAGGLSALRSLQGQPINVALADGSVRTLNRSLTHETWKLALSPADGQVLGADW